MELVEYIRSRKYREVVEEKMEIVYKKDSNGNPTDQIDRKRLWVRLGRGKPIGVIISNGAGSVGWSLVKHPDKFDRTMALNIARERELYHHNDPVPYSIQDQVQKMLNRSKKTFTKE